MDVWFVLYCKPKKDHIAERNLINQGYEAYRPVIIITTRSSKGDRCIRRESLFPRYVFVKAVPEERSLMPASYTRGVLGFVKFGDKYATVSEEIVGSIRKCELEQQEYHENKKDFVKGDSVYLSGDCFNNIKATFVKEHGDHRVVVLLRMLGTESMVMIQSDYVSKSPKY